MTNTKTFGVWRGMLSRCLNPRSPAYKDYGGRGITVCERWRSFENFLADMGERPLGKSIDRYPDNDGNYEPGNCRWATSAEQNRNRRDNILTQEVAEQIRSLKKTGLLQKDIADIVGVSKSVVSDVVLMKTWRTTPAPTSDSDR